MTLELILGRGLACCVRPGRAWQVMTRGGRALLLGTYAAAGFGLTLAALALL